MSLYLHKLDNFASQEWFQRSGFEDELDFWSSLSGLSEGSMYDHIVYYLTSLGYTGDEGDKIRTFIMDQVGYIGTTFDNANEMFLGLYSPTVTPSGAYIQTEDGLNITTESGDSLITE